MLQQLLSTGRILMVALIAGIPVLSIGLTPAAASTDIPVRTVESWLHRVDRLEYDASRSEASQFFQQKLTKENWEAILKFTRAPIGTVIARRHTVTQYASHLPGIPDGTYAILQFHSAFTGKDSTVETVVFSKEADGQWRAIGYSMK